MCYLIKIFRCNASTTFPVEHQNFTQISKWYIWFIIKHKHILTLTCNCIERYILFVIYQIFNSLNKLSFGSEKRKEIICITILGCVTATYSCWTWSVASHMRGCFSLKGKIPPHFSANEISFAKDVTRCHVHYIQFNKICSSYSHLFESYLMICCPTIRHVIKIYQQNYHNNTP